MVHIAPTPAIQDATTIMAIRVPWASPPDEEVSESFDDFAALAEEDEEESERVEEPDGVTITTEVD